MIHLSPTPSSLFQPLKPWMRSLPSSSSVLISRELRKHLTTETLGANYNIPITKPSLKWWMFLRIFLLLLSMLNLCLWAPHLFPSPHVSLILSICLSCSLSLSAGVSLFVCFCPSALLDTHPHPKPCLCFISWFLQPFPAVSTHIHYQMFLRRLRESSQGLCCWPEGTTTRWHRSPPRCSLPPSPLCLTHHLYHPQNYPLTHLLLTQVHLFCSLPSMLSSRPQDQHQSGIYLGIPSVLWLAVAKVRAALVWEGGQW